MSGIEEGDGRPIIVFDGLCVLCSGWARFVLRHDRRARFRLAAIQAAAGRSLAERFGVDPDDPRTILLVERDRAFRDSDAILRILGGLGPPWRALAVLRMLPRRVRDPAYRLVARNRYRLFGRRDACWLPGPGDASRIL